MEKLQRLGEMTWRTNQDGEPSVTIADLEAVLGKWKEFAEFWDMSDMQRCLEDFLK